MAFLLFHNKHTGSFALVLFTTLLVSAPASADRPGVYLWGFQHDCERTLDIDRRVEKQLFTERGDVALLRTEGGQPLPACPSGQQERCVQTLRAACPATQGRVLGGQVVKGREVLRSRLWLYDLATGQIAYQDDYCESCDLAMALSAQARHLIDQPRFGAAQGLPAKPVYCAAAAASAPATATPPPSPIFLTVLGDSRHKATLYAALKQQLGLRGRPVLQMPWEPRGFSPQDMQRILADHKDAQVLGAEIRKDGKGDNAVLLFLYDGRTQRIADRLVDCPDCFKEKDVVVTRLQPEVAALLDHCFALQCADPSARPAPLPPVEACEPWPEARCAAAGLWTTPASRWGESTGPHMDPMTAKWVQGLAWGAFAVSAATALSLAIANPLVTKQRGTQEFDNTLSGPALTAAGISVGVLGVAVPITYFVGRAQKQSSPAQKPSLAMQLQCPN